MNENQSPLPRGNGLKKTSGIAIAALLVFGVVVGAVSFSLTHAYAASSITTSTNKFFGPDLLRVLITDNTKTLLADTITPHVDVKRGSTVLGSADPSITNIGTSGTFEFYMTTANGTLAPAAPSQTAGGGAIVVRANPNPSATGASAGTSSTGAATAGITNVRLPTSSAMRDGDSVVIQYNGQTVTVQFATTAASSGNDRQSAGDGNKITVTLTDQDANVDPVGIDKFITTVGIISATPAITTGNALFIENGQNTGVFELIVTVNGAASATNENVAASMPNAVSFTESDKDEYRAITGSIAGTSYIASGSSQTSSTSVTLQNVDGAIALTGTPTLADGIPVKVTDSDRNIDTKTKDAFPDATAARVFVTVDGVTALPANFNQTMKETDLNTGVFLPDTSGGTISVGVGASDSVGAGGITLTPSTIAGDPDISISYTDPAKSPSGTATFKTVTHVSHTAGTISSDAKAGVTDKFTVTITDPELNTDSGSVQSYVSTFNNLNSQTIPISLVSNGAQMGNLTLTVRGSGIDTTVNNVVLTFIETGANTGVFAASTVDMNKINLDTPGGLKDGDQLQFKYFDQTESPVSTSTATLTVGKPSAAISVDKSTEPLPAPGQSTKVTVTITDPTKNFSPGSQDTFSLLAAGISITDSNSGTPATTSIGGLVDKTFTETGPSTGVFTASYTLTNPTPGAGGFLSIALENGAKVKFTYGTNTASVTLKSYDGVLSTNIGSVGNGDIVKIILSEQDGNRDPATVDTLSVIATTQNDPISGSTNLPFEVKETGTDTGVFTKDIVIGTDLRIADLTANTFAETIKFTYADAIASDNSAQTRELTVKVGSHTGSVTVTPTKVGPGTKVSILVDDKDLNVSPGGVDTVGTGTIEYLRVTSDRSGVNTLTTAQGEETGANTGQFKTTLTLSPLKSPATPVFAGTSDEITGTVLPGDIVSVRYTDQKDVFGNKITVSKIFEVTSADPEITTDNATISADSSFHVTVADVDANADGDSVDSIKLKVTSTSDPVGYDVTALETGPNTGVFDATVTTTSSVSAGSITVRMGDSITVKYNDKYPADYADRVKMVVDPSKDFTINLPVGAKGPTSTTTTPSKAAPTTIEGKSISEVKAGMQIVLLSTIQNNEDTPRDFVALITTADSDGAVVSIKIVSGQLPAKGESKVGGDFTPDSAGTYKVKVFVLSDLASPIILATPSETTLNVS